MARTQHVRGEVGTALYKQRGLIREGNYILITVWKLHLDSGDRKTTDWTDDDPISTCNNKRGEQTIHGILKKTANKVKAGQSLVLLTRFSCWNRIWQNLTAQYLRAKTARPVICLALLDSPLEVEADVILRGVGWCHVTGWIRRGYVVTEETRSEGSGHGCLRHCFQNSTFLVIHSNMVSN